MTTLSYKELISLPEDFDYSSVIKIDVSRCKLRSLIELKLERFTNLQELNCSYNKLTNLYGLSNCKSLQELNCEKNRITKLDGISNCTSLQRLLCYSNHLTNLNDISNCISLQSLNCSRNLLTDIDGIAKCISLETLCLDSNYLENLDGLINCRSLEVLTCDFNELENLHGLTNCTSLENLICDFNELENLDGLSNCTSLKYLQCGCNKLENLNALSNCKSLQLLKCSQNLLTNIDPLANCTSLRDLYCDDNKITTLLPIRNLRNLNYVNYHGNPFEGPHHPAILRILNRNENNTIYNDYQNVHDSKINTSVNSSINNLLKAHSNSIKSEEEIISKLNELKFPRIENLKTWFNNKDVHSYFNMTYFEVFQLVFAEIERLNYDPEIIKRLEEELKDSEGMCFTGYLNRTVNCLNSFSEHVSIKISDIFQINAVMSIIMNDYEKGKIKKEELLDTVKRRLKEYNTKEEDIEFYLKTFSELYLE